MGPGFGIRGSGFANRESGFGIGDSRVTNTGSRFPHPDPRAVARSEQIKAREKRNPEAYAVYVEGFRRPRTKRCEAYRRGARGFTLLEVMVALAIMSIAIVTMIQLFAQGIRLLKSGGDHQRAVLLADQKLREVGSVTEGIEEGEEDSFRWERRITKVPEPDGSPETVAVNPLHTYQVSIEVRWGKGKVLEVATLRTAREETP
ncbi:MAG TPA: prepilin-type N-terminal cleavage/methylation domain-containing protein [Methylomirabilota bacterium]|nr:prepilin-type N-terminal cleavage/methylation domain-containing protein [Methylomirabilota bacterium]